MVIDPKFTKPVDSYLSLQVDENELKSIFQKSLTFSLANRADITDEKSNWFSSFNLPTSRNQLTTGSTLSKLFPELQQLNVDNIIVSPIPSSEFSEVIDGRSITFSFPQSGGTSQVAMSAVTITSSTYTGDQILKVESSQLLRDNIVFLFCDAINRPFTGDTVDEIGQITSHVANTSWNPDPLDFTKRPSAVAYSEVKRQLSISGVPTDNRVGINFANTSGITASYPDNRNCYKYDIPVGFVKVDDGIVVITHPALVNNFPWNSGFTASNDQAYSVGDVKSKKNIYFTGTTSPSNEDVAFIEFENIDTSFKTNVVCIAMPREFYISNNPTWPRNLALSSLNEASGIINIDPVQISEVGLYNALGELVAVAKLDRAVEKDYTSVMTFVLDLEM